LCKLRGWNVDKGTERSSFVRAALLCWKVTNAGQSVVGQECGWWWNSRVSCGGDVPSVDDCASGWNMDEDIEIILFPSRSANALEGNQHRVTSAGTGTCGW
jgi:hypothetical protein